MHPHAQLLLQCNYVLPNRPPHLPTLILDPKSNQQLIPSLHERLIRQLEPGSAGGRVYRRLRFPLPGLRLVHRKQFPEVGERNATNGMSIA
jgi:hypothetical protein